MIDINIICSIHENVIISKTFVYYKKKTLTLSNNIYKMKQYKPIFISKIK